MAIQPIEQETPMLPEPQGLPNVMRTAVFTMMARWGASPETFERIATSLYEEYNIVAPVEELARLYDNNRVRVVAIRKDQRKGIAMDVERIMGKAQLLLGRELNRAIRDSDRRAELDAALASGVLEPKDYRRQVKTLKQMSISDIVKVANHAATMGAIINGSKPPAEPQPPTPQETTPPPNPKDDPTIKAIAAASERGDMEELQRLAFPKAAPESPPEPK